MTAPQASPQATPPTGALSALRATLWSFRREFLWVGALSAVANLLMLTPTLYMLQVYDRVLISQNTATLVSISLICLFLVGIMTLSEWTRSRILVHAGMRLRQRFELWLLASNVERSEDEMRSLARQNFLRVVG